MKVEIKKDGILNISAETELEAYALEKWCDDNIDYNKMSIKKILINHGVKKNE